METGKIMKLKCNTVQRFISDYIDDTLSSSDTAKVEKHLQSCRMCQHEVTALKKTRDLVVDFYVEPEVPDNYYRQFEVELHRCIENKGPTTLIERLKTSVLQLTWSLLTRLRQSFGRYSLIRMNALPLGMVFVLIVTGFVATHLLKQEVSPPSNVPPQQVTEPLLSEETPIIIDEETVPRHGIYNKRKTKAPGEVSSPTLAADADKVGYWKLADPLNTETEGHIIVMHINNDRSVPSDAADSELIVYAEPDMLSRKSPLQDGNYAALALEFQVDPFLEKYQRKQRKLPGFVDKLMNTPAEMITMPKLNGLNKL